MYDTYVYIGFTGVAIGYPVAVGRWLGSLCRMFPTHLRSFLRFRRPSRTSSPWMPVSSRRSCKRCLLVSRPQFAFL